MSQVHKKVKKHKKRDEKVKSKLESRRHELEASGGNKNKGKTQVHMVIISAIVIGIAFFIFFNM